MSENRAITLPSFQNMPNSSAAKQYLHKDIVKRTLETKVT